MSAARTALALGLVAAAPLVMGCGLAMEGTYLIGPRQYNKTVQERRPTGQVSTEVAYAAVPGDGGQARLSCEERERRIERSFTVEKTFAYRGGLDATPYVAGAIASGLLGALTAGVLAGICLHEPEPGSPPKLSCLNMLYASPLGVDMVYSIIRATTAKPAKLVDKRRTEGMLAFAEHPTQTKPVACDSVQRVVLGHVNGPSETDVLNGLDNGRPSVLQDDALPVTLGEGGVFSLAEQPAVVQAWAKDPSLGLWVVDGEGAPHPVNSDRCAVLRPLSTMLAAQDLFAFQKTCPLSPPPQQR